jgi:hypothetical protein
MKRASRELVGTLLGRANLGVAFFDPAQSGGYLDQAISVHEGESGEETS